MSDGARAIQCYVSPSGNNKIAEWYEGLSVQDKADADEFIKNMRRTREWKMPKYRPLKGYRGMGELRWRSEGKQHRLIGYLKDNTFFALIGCIHKGKIYTPRDALETAEKRKKEIENRQGRTVEYDL